VSSARSMGPGCCHDLGTTLGPVSRPSVDNSSQTGKEAAMGTDPASVRNAVEGDIEAFAP
jgi:hypothetical protein